MIFFRWHGNLKKFCWRKFHTDASFILAVKSLLKCSMFLPLSLKSKICTLCKKIDQENIKNNYKKWIKSFIQLLKLIIKSVKAEIKLQCYTILVFISKFMP